MKYRHFKNFLAIGEPEVRHDAMGQCQQLVERPAGNDAEECRWWHDETKPEGIDSRAGADVSDSYDLVFMCGKDFGCTLHESK